MKDQNVASLVEQFRENECQGIARFLEFLHVELDDGEQKLVLELLFTKRLGRQKPKIRDPFVFFTLFLAERKQNQPFVDKGVKLLDTICAEIVQLWDATEHGVQ